MNDLERNRQAICDFFNEKKPNQAEKPARAAINSEAKDPLQALSSVGAAGLAQVWEQHPLKQSYDQILPIAQSTVRQYPWLSLGAASALGALLVLSPGLRSQALQAVQGQLPADLKKWL